MPLSFLLAANFAATTTMLFNQVNMEEGEVKKVEWRTEKGRVEKGVVEEVGKGWQRNGRMSKGLCCCGQKEAHLGISDRDGPSLQYRNT